ncbi:hypothetical protein BH18ACT7_BH18ACT7_10590 [soil metagenome]
MMVGVDVRPWPGVHVLDRLAGGARWTVFGARRGDHDLVVRRSSRSPAALDWELDLVAHLAEHDLRVPLTVPSADGRRHVDGVVVQEFLPGRPPVSDDDWRAVVDLLYRMHELTRGWPQRPGFASSRGLQHRDTGGDVDLSAMPPAAKAAVRKAWRRADTGEECAIHGDVGGGNVLVHRGVAGLIDWDESRVDLPLFDYAHRPFDVADDVVRAGVAWEAATCWLAEPEYAARRLDELHVLNMQ